MHNASCMAGMAFTNAFLTLKECGINENEFESKVDYLAEKAFEDQCTTANPRMPLITELANLYRKSYK